MPTPFFLGDDHEGVMIGEACRIDLGEAALAEALSRVRDAVGMFARRPVRPLDVGVPVDDERLSASHQQAAQLGQRGITEFVQYVEREDTIDSALQRSEFGRGDRRYVRHAAFRELAPEVREHRSVLVEFENPHAWECPRDRDRIGARPCAEVDESGRFVEVEQRDESRGRKIFEARRVVERAARAGSKR